MLVLRRLYSRRRPSARIIQKSKLDPGISKQRKLFGKDDVEEIDFEELESDFTNVHKSHREHIEQMKTWKEHEKYLIVKQKYFSEKYPNFLTWHNKEQIRYLHNNDPEEWTIEKLSEGFPALPDVIKKIIKSNWSKRSRTKIVSHDKGVIQNWSDFKLGRLNNLPDDLKVHLQKFSNRALNLNVFEGTDEKNIIQNRENSHKKGEFSEIISSYERLKKQTVQPEVVQKGQNFKFNLKNNISEVVKLTENENSKKYDKPITLKELQYRIEKDISRGKDINQQDRIILHQTSQHKEEDFNTTITLRPEEFSKIIEQKHQTNHDKLGFVQKRNKDMSHLIYPEKIVIPQQHYKKGYTYKLNDCYYDCDGEFLYRVPGMS